MDGLTANRLVLAELAPYQSTNELANAEVVGQTMARGAFKLKIPRWDGSRDRLYSGFIAVTATNGLRSPGGEIHYVEDMRGVAKYNEAFPRAASKKGLQVQMVDDAIALGVKHAALNVDIPALGDVTGNADNPTWELDGVTYYFHRRAVEALGQKVKTLSDAGMVVTLILLCYQNGDPAVNQIMMHPKLSPETPHRLSKCSTRSRRRDCGISRRASSSWRTDIRSRSIPADAR